MDIRILFKNGCEFHFENIKGYKAENNYLQIVCNTGYKRSFSFDDIECYTIKGD